MYVVLIPNSNDVTCATIASEVTTHGGIEIYILLLLLLLFGHHLLSGPLGNLGRVLFYHFVTLLLRYDTAFTTRDVLGG